MKNWGGHFTPESGGHFELESGAHFKLELGGQYHRNMHHTEFKKNDIVERQQLIKRICENIWSVDYFNKNN